MSFQVRPDGPYQKLSGIKARQSLAYISEGSLSGSSSVSSEQEVVKELLLNFNTYAGKSGQIEPEGLKRYATQLRNNNLFEKAAVCDDLAASYYLLTMLGGKRKTNIYGYRAQDLRVVLDKLNNGQHLNDVIAAQKESSPLTLTNLSSVAQIADCVIGFMTFVGVSIAGLSLRSLKKFKRF